jgi:hypothetical protein
MFENHEDRTSEVPYCQGCEHCSRIRITSVHLELRVTASVTSNFESVVRRSQRSSIGCIRRHLMRIALIDLFHAKPSSIRD